MDLDYTGCDATVRLNADEIRAMELSDGSKVADPDKFLAILAEVLTESYKGAEIVVRFQHPHDVGYGIVGSQFPTSGMETALVEDIVARMGDHLQSALIRMQAEG